MATIDERIKALLAAQEETNRKMGELARTAIAALRKRGVSDAEIEAAFARGKKKRAARRKK